MRFRLEVGGEKHFVASGDPPYDRAYKQKHLSIRLYNKDTKVSPRSH